MAQPLRAVAAHPQGLALIPIHKGQLKTICISNHMDQTFTDTQHALAIHSAKNYALKSILIKNNIYIEKIFFTIMNHIYMHFFHHLYIWCPRRKECIKCNEPGKTGNSEPCNISENNQRQVHKGSRTTNSQASKYAIIMQTLEIFHHCFCLLALEGEQVPATWLLRDSMNFYPSVNGLPSLLPILFVNTLTLNDKRIG